MSDMTQLRITRVVKATRQRVFQAWTRPDLMMKWLAPGAMNVVSATADVRVGGAYRIAMAGTTDGGKCLNSAVEGVYTKIVEGELLSFTWGWPGDGATKSTVTVTLRDVHGGTEIILTHVGLIDSETTSKHEHGWNGCFDKLMPLCESLTNGHPEPFSRTLKLRAPRGQVYDAIASVTGIRAWWTADVTGSYVPDGEIRLGFAGMDEHIILHIDHATCPSSTKWTCVIHTDIPEWTGTSMVFNLIEYTSQNTELQFTHQGLTRNLTCFDHCEVGWDHFLASLKAYVELGAGMPFGQAAREANLF